jgi:type IV pilus assembly protein PilA
MNNSAPSSSSEPSILLPVLAIVFFVLFWPIGLILSIVSIVKFGSAKGTTAKTLAIIAMVMNVALAVPLVGCLAAIAIPNFVKFQCRSKQSEAKGNLKALAVAQMSHQAEKEAFSTDLTAIGFTPFGTKVRYTYSVVEATKDTFRAEATGIDEMAGDRWVITEKMALENLESRCD